MNNELNMKPSYNMLYSLSSEKGWPNNSDECLWKNTSPTSIARNIM